MPHFGLQIASIVLIGQNIGAQHIARARRYHNIIQLMGTFQSVFLACSIFLFGGHLAAFFTSLPTLQEKVTTVLNFYGIIGGK